MRVVVDANVVIAAALRPAGPTRKMLMSKRHRWFAPRSLLDEVSEHEVELAERSQAPVARWRAAVSRIGREMQWIPSRRLARHVPSARRMVSDPDDVPYVACALAVRADFLWTHDRALAVEAPCAAGPWPEAV